MRIFKDNGRPVLFYLFLFFHVIAFGQKKDETKPSKEETQKWIREKIESSSYNADDGKTKNDYSISFDNENLIIKNKHWTDLYDTLNAVAKIPIKDIDYIYYTEKPYNFWLTIKLKAGKKEIQFINNDFIEPDGKFEILLNKNFKENNLPERMKKSFSRLIELYGGQTSSTKETY